MFDFGNVLVHFETQRFYDFLTAHQHSDEARPEEFFNFNHVIEYDLGLIDEVGYYEAVQRAYKLDVGMNRFFWEFVDVMSPDQKLIRLKQVLKQNGVKVALVSNINRYHFEYVSQRWPEVFMDFDYLALSFQLQARKPDLKMYRVPASYLQARSEECLLVDDNEPNLLAFQGWGGTGYHYNVVDGVFCPNGRLDIERRGLLFRLASWGLISFSQASDIV